MVLSRPSTRVFPEYSPSTSLILPVSKSSAEMLSDLAFRRRFTSLETRMILLPGFSAIITSAAFRMRWSGLFSPNTFTASSSLCSFITTLNLPPFGIPSDIHLVSVALFDRRSMIRMNSLASKLMVSFPFLKLSSSSSTVIGMATSLSSKLRIALWLYKITEVSRTKIFLVFSAFFTMEQGCFAQK